MAAACVVFTVSTAHAAGSGMPWEAPLQRILESVQGPVAKIVAVIIIIITGLTLAFGETAGGFRRLIQIVFGLSIAFAASSTKNSANCRRRRRPTANSTGRSTRSNRRFTTGWNASAASAA